MSGCFKADAQDTGRTSSISQQETPHRGSGLLFALLIATSFTFTGISHADPTNTAPAHATGPQLTALNLKDAQDTNHDSAPGSSRSAKPLPDAVVVDATEYPWSAIGRLNTGGRGYCTGILVDEYHVLTDAHCLFYRTEGRWWQPNELHFVAGYQRDTSVVHSRVTRYELAPGYPAHGGVSLASILNNWALVKLEKPLGNQAGWLGLKNLDRKLMQRLKKGSGALLQAGYRRDAQHAITLGLDCGPKGFFSAKNRIGHRCQLKPGRADLPFLVYMDGGFNLVANHVISSITRQPPRTGSLANAGFRAKLKRGESRAPKSSAMASPVPSGTITNLLESLGYLRSSESTRESQAHKAAIESFESAEGMPVTGKASVALLGKIIEIAY